MNEKFYSIKEVAQILGLHRITTAKLIHSGQLKSISIRPGRYKITETALKEFIKSIGG
jgi:excisionase family DNA binding protein